MAPNPRKRKVVTRATPDESVEDEELGDGLLEGILSHSEDESDDEAAASAGSSAEEDPSDDEADEESGDEPDLESDEVPSDGEEDIRRQLRNLSTAEGPLKRKTSHLTHEQEEAEAGDAEHEAEASEDDDLKPNYTVTTDAHGNTRYLYHEIDPVYESDDSDAPATANTIGNISLSYYDNYPHIGYDINGKKIMRPAKGEALDALLDSIDLPKGWTGLTDPATGKPLELTEEELDVLRKITRNEIPEEGYNPYPEMVPYFTGKLEVMPLSAAPEPKRRFVPSKHEAKRVMKIVRAIREGRIQPYKPPTVEEEEEATDFKTYDIWADEVPRPEHNMHIAAPKMPPPGYDQSYHPPPEYLPDKQEKETWRETEEEEREKEYLPTSYDALRKVPGYERFVKERFERCLDLYLAPRVRRNKLNIDPESLLPKLPSPDELRPFPTTCAAIFRGHEGRVRSVSVDPRGIFLASGGDDGFVRVWELLTGRQLWNVKLADEDAVDTVKWRPGKDAAILAAAAGEDIFLIVPFAILSPDVEQTSRDLIDAGWGYAAAKPSTTTNGATKEPPARWSRPGKRLEDKGVLVQATVRSTVKVINWHRRGEYFATVSPRGQSSAVAIHTLSKHLTQLPFRRLKGIAQSAQFHPSKPIFFVATKNSIRSYDLARQELVKILQPGAKWISSFDVHPGGDNLIVGTYDKRLLWHDLDLSTKPYKTLRYHQEAIRAVRFHQGGLPLFADASDDGSIQIFHGKVVGDLMENATIVPLKVLRGHQVKSRLGVMDVDWHPREPWCVSAGADGTCRLWN
ncbi:putative ribosome biogenesis protein Erb1 [Amniculicola lignicola CBS 123094]|uniref:Ribosome biogenesis protein ERB1 n=1 Tax=Amniculicola lignicola CBS 123094 TaxID=1392246 RepID=A0A6A5W7Q1_9PLEO|nr:putative ribosome biogenesis protein Erb1 [Amniculicola lignicola CBS 123094]